MLWIDIHAHLDVEPLVSDLRNVLVRAQNANIKVIIVPGICGEVKDFNFPNWVYRCFGVHPGICENFTPNQVIKLFNSLNYKPIAIGEIGLDLIANNNIEHQKLLFTTQLEIANKNRLPIILHIRKGWKIALEILSSYAINIPWIFHSYCGTYEFAKEILRVNKNSYFSFSGSVGYKNAKKTPLVAKNIPKGHILLETDSPDIKIPWGNINYSEPYAIPEIAQYLANLRNENINDISLYVKENFLKIWNDIKI